ncbi:acyl-CoA N-acyltransferase [Obelidium mucronatum]|nr:acyl-CoA N-acyltransferase [Obelidium mucronatum]
MHTQKKGQRRNRVKNLIMSFTLSAFKPTDAQDLMDLLQDPTIHENTLIIPNPYTLEHAEWFINHCTELHQQWRNQGRGNSPLQQAIRNLDGRVIGNISLEYHPGISGTTATAQLGYYLHKDYRGRGIMPAAVKQMLQYAFSQDWDIERVNTSTFAGNKASRRVVEKSGFVFLEFVKGKYAKDGVKERIDADTFTLTKSDYYQMSLMI